MTFARPNVNTLTFVVCKLALEFWWKPKTRLVKIVPRASILERMVKNFKITCTITLNIVVYTLHLVRKQNIRDEIVHRQDKGKKQRQYRSRVSLHDYPKFTCAFDHYQKYWFQNCLNLTVSWVINTQSTQRIKAFKLGVHTSHVYFASKKVK